MNTLKGSVVFDQYLSDTLHEETQVEERSVSLTVSAIYELIGSGDLDFGGSEFQLADRAEVEPAKRDPDDDYGWWSLNEGTWIMELNENITYSNPFEAVLQPHEHLIWNGGSHPTLHLDENDADMRILLPLSAPESGINLKENARVSVLRVTGSGQ